MLTTKEKELMTTFQNAEVIETAALAIANGSGIGFCYTKADGEEDYRRVIPLSIDTTKDGEVIIRTFDTDRNAWRSYRVDRVEEDSIVFFDPREEQ
jgi:predicted DNA-binding transcriptional regulator YafY